MPENETLGASSTPSGADGTSGDSTAMGDDASYEQIFAQLLGGNPPPAEDNSSQQEEAGNAPADTGQRQSQAVPYERFVEVNQRLKDAEEKLQQFQPLASSLGTDVNPSDIAAQIERYNRFASVVEQLEQQGYRSAEEVEAALQQQQRDAQLAQFEQQRIAHYQQQIAEGEMDADYAALALERDKLQQQIEAVMTQYRDDRLREQKARAFALYPDAKAGEPFVDALIATGTPPSAAAEKVAKVLAGLKANVQNDVASRGPAAPQPMGGRESSPATPTTPPGARQQTSLQETLRRSWEDIFGLTPDKNKL